MTQSTAAPPSAVAQSTTVSQSADHITEKSRKRFRSTLNNMIKKLETLAEDNYAEFGLLMIEKQVPNIVQPRPITTAGILSSHLMHTVALNTALLNYSEVWSSNNTPEANFFDEIKIIRNRTARFVVQFQQKVAKLASGERFDATYNVSQCPDWCPETMWRDPRKMSLPDLKRCITILIRHVVGKLSGISLFKQYVKRGICSPFPSLIESPDNFDALKFIEDEFNDTCTASCKQPEEVKHLLLVVKSKKICILNHVDTVQGNTLAQIIDNIYHENENIKVVCLVKDPATSTADSNQSRFQGVIRANMQSKLYGSHEPLSCSIISECNIIFHQTEEDELDNLPEKCLASTHNLDNLIHSPPPAECGMWQLLKSLSMLYDQLHTLLHKYSVTVSCIKGNVCHWLHFFNDIGALQRPILCTKWLFQEISKMQFGLSWDICDGCVAEVLILTKVCENIAELTTRLNEKLQTWIENSGSTTEQTMQPPHVPSSRSRATSSSSESDASSSSVEKHLSAKKTTKKVTRSTRTSRMPSSRSRATSSSSESDESSLSVEKYLSAKKTTRSTRTSRKPSSRSRATSSSSSESDESSLSVEKYLSAKKTTRSTRTSRKPSSRSRATSSSSSESDESSLSVEKHLSAKKTTKKVTRSTRTSRKPSSRSRATSSSSSESDESSLSVEKHLSAKKTTRSTRTSRKPSSRSRATSSSSSESDESSLSVEKHLSAKRTTKKVTRSTRTSRKPSSRSRATSSSSSESDESSLSVEKHLSAKKTTRSTRTSRKPSSRSHATVNDSESDKSEVQGKDILDKSRARSEGGGLTMLLESVQAIEQKQVAEVLPGNRNEPLLEVQSKDTDSVVILSSLSGSNHTRSSTPGARRATTDSSRSKRVTRGPTTSSNETVESTTTKIAQTRQSKRIANKKTQPKKN